MDIHCSFCGKAAQDVEKMISGPEVRICNECIVLCADALRPIPLVDELEEEQEEYDLSDLMVELRAVRAETQALADRVEASMVKAMRAICFEVVAETAPSLRQQAIEATIAKLKRPTL